LSVSHVLVTEHRCISKLLLNREINSNSRLRPPLNGGNGR
jgi:hypothetical protein